MTSPNLSRRRSAPRLPTYSALALLAVLCARPSANAATLTWDTVSNGATIDAGSGTWDTTPGNAVWNDAGANGVWSQTSATAATNSAVFAGTDGTYAITVGTGVATSALTFSNSGYTLGATAARSVFLPSAATISVAANKTATVGTNVTLRSQNGLVNGGGTLAVSGTGAVLTDGGGTTVNVVGGSTVDVKTGGTLSTGTALVVGRAEGSGTVAVNGGAVAVTTNLVLANVTSGSVNGTLTVNSGTVTANQVDGGLRYGNGSPSNVTTVGTVDLNGGTLTVGKVFIGNASSTGIASNFNFNGGTLKVLSGSTVAGAFMSGLTSANVKEGGAVIDTNNKTATIGQALLHGGVAATDGGLTKTGLGALTLTGTNSYTGATSVQTGTLDIGGSGSINNTARVIVASGAFFSKSSSVALSTAFTLNEGASVIGSGITATGVNVFADLSDGFTTIPSSIIQGGTLRFDLTNPIEGSYTIFSGAAGSFAGVSIGSTSLFGSGVFSGVVGGLTYTFTDSTDLLVISAIPEPAAFAAVAGLTCLVGLGIRRTRRS